MFERIEKNDTETKEFSFFFQGQHISARKGDTVAAALLAAGVLRFRKTPVSGRSRGPFCMMGACFECLIDLNGNTVQACMTQAQPNAEIHMPSVPELLEEADDGTV